MKISIKCIIYKQILNYKVIHMLTFKSKQLYKLIKNVQIKYESINK